MLVVLDCNLMPSVSSLLSKRHVQLGLSPIQPTDLLFFHGKLKQKQF